MFVKSLTPSARCFLLNVAWSLEIMSKAEKKQNEYNNQVDNNTNNFDIEHPKF